MPPCCSSFASASTSRPAAVSSDWCKNQCGGGRGGNGRWGPSTRSKPTPSHVTFCSSGTNTFFAFLIIGCGFSSSSEKRCLRGLKSSPPGTLESTRSVGSGWKFTSTSISSGSIAVGVTRSASLSTSCKINKNPRHTWITGFAVTGHLVFSIKYYINGAVCQIKPESLPICELVCACDTFIVY